MDSSNLIRITLKNGGLQANGTESGTNWAYSASSWRAANNNTNYRLNLIVGLAHSTLRLRVQSSLAPSSAGYTLYNGIAEDSTTTSHADEKNSMIGSIGSAAYAVSSASMIRQPATGFHYYQWTELTWTGTGSNGSWHGEDAGMIGEIDG